MTKLSRQQIKEQQIKDSIAAWPANLQKCLAAVTTMNGEIQVSNTGEIRVSYYDLYSTRCEYTLCFTATEVSIWELNRAYNNITFDLDEAITDREKREKTQQLINSALSKLTDEEKAALNLE